MKRGYTKPFSNGRLGEEQRRDKACLESAAWHEANGNIEKAAILKKKRFGR